MKKIIVMSLAIRLWTVSWLYAQTTAQVQKADLAIPFGTVSGKIVMAGDHLVFIDEERPDHSFVVARSEVEDLAIQDRTAGLQLRRPVQDRSGERSKLNFRLTQGDPMSLKRWFGSTATASTTPEPALSVRNRSQATASQSTNTIPASNPETVLPTFTA